MYVHGFSGGQVQEEGVGLVRPNNRGDPMGAHLRQLSLHHRQSNRRSRTPSSAHSKPRVYIELRLWLGRCLYFPRRIADK